MINVRAHLRALILTLSVALGFTLVGVSPASAASRFADVGDDNMYATEIAWLADSGIATGWPDGTFRPYAPVARDAMAAFLYRLFDEPEFTPTGQTFSDVAPDNQFYREIEWLAASGIATGWPDGTFRPYEPVNRDAMAAFLHRAWGAPSYTASGDVFTDVASQNQYVTQIEWLADAGISTGWPDGTFRPVQPIARDAIAAFLYRAVTTLGRPGPLVADPLADADVVVAADGSGDVTTVAEAIAQAPSDTSAWRIGIRPGTYREVVQLRRSNVTLLGGGGSPADVVITYDNAAGTPKPDGSGTYGTTGSATMLITGNDVTVRNLTIENAFDEAAHDYASEQAVALKTQGDRLVFDTVRLLGDQDTLYADSPAAGRLARSYYVNSFIEGDVDFIFGRGTAVFDRSTLHASDRGSTSNNGYVTAASTDVSLPYGFLITDSTITSDAPAGTFHLGRPWQPSGDAQAIAQVVVRNTVLPDAIAPAPWTDMTSTFSWRNARFAEYGNTGPGAVVNADRPQLTTVEAADHTKFTYLAGPDGWNPTGEQPPADVTAPATPTGLAAEASDGSVVLTWQPVTDADLAGYTLYRVEGAGPVDLASATAVATDLTDTSFRDRGVVNQTSYTWVVTAVDAAGNASAPSAAVTATPVGAVLPAHDVLVAADGSGDYTTVQDALDATAPGTASDPVVIAIKPGVYHELVTVAQSHLTLLGTTGKAADVVLTYDNASGTPTAGGGTLGTSKSQSVKITGSDVTVRDLTIENAFDEAAHDYQAEQAVALHTTGDRLVFTDVRLLGNQDTLLANSPDADVVSRVYFYDSYIEGDVDFIFGRATAVFDASTIHALSRGSNSNNGYLTAASTSDQNPFGFLVVNSRVTSDAPAGTVSLGRPWRGWGDGYTKGGVVYNSRGQVTFRNTELSVAIRTAQPWADMTPLAWTDGRFAEFGNTGAGAAIVDPATRPQLTDAEASDATPRAYLAGSDGWDPVLG
ncbi:pectinesterase family protein [Propioniciclava soli]|uniref:pectinesterase family protein n=1 Tax=Propioniciclava soli TaxID=2775081 RepID=UPI001E2D4652|nr:pectinesterase family protein [Propioniciclava soli]